MIFKRTFSHWKNYKYTTQFVRHRQSVALTQVHSNYINPLNFKRLISLDTILAPLLRIFTWCFCQTLLLSRYLRKCYCHWKKRCKTVSRQMSGNKNTFFIKFFLRSQLKAVKIQGANKYRIVFHGRALKISCHRM